MNKINRNRFIMLIIFFISCSTIYYYINNMVYVHMNKVKLNNIDKMLNEPIDLNTGLINNDYWNISSNGTNATETRKGINDAIEYASQNKIEYIKLEKGIYLVDNILVDKYQRSIILKSNLNLDLNGSIIQIQPNSDTRYGIITAYDINNASIYNGILIGDRYEHTYSENSTHEWGMGVDIRGCRNILVSNLEIYNMTGDGIYLSQYENEKQLSEDINISNCHIYNTRRQGISIITANNVKIYNNEIHDINGTLPLACINLESNYSTQIIKNIFIYNNKLYNSKSKKAVFIFSKVENVYINNNEIYGDININENKNSNNDKIFIKDNNILKEKKNLFNGEDISITDNFKDTNLKNAILELVGKTSDDLIYESDIAKIASDGVPGGKQLNLSNKGITKLDGIEIFAKYNLEWLYIDNNNIEDLSPISSIQSLTKLNASNNNITNITSLQTLMNLKTINLINNSIEDVSILSNMNNLEYLYLNNNKIKSLDSVSNLNTIKEIYCEENEIENIDNILNLLNIEKINARKNKIKNIVGNINSETLKYLNISENNLTDISGLTENKISYLNLNNQSIKLYTGQIVDSEYVQINLPKIFSMIDDTYNIEIENLSYYEFKDNNSIIILTNEFIANGLKIKVLKDDYTYINYTIIIDNEIYNGLKEKYNIIRTPKEFILTGINLEKNKIQDFIQELNLNEKNTISFNKNNDIVNIEDIITTGTRMQVFNTEKNYYQDYTIVVYGDTTGDGDINSLDALNVIYNKLNFDNLQLDINDAYVEAGRVTEETRNEIAIPSSVDALAIIKHKLELNEIKQ